MTNKERNEMSSIVKKVINNKLGLSVASNNIEFYESSYNGLVYDYILFAVKGSDVMYTIRKKHDTLENEYELGISVYSKETDKYGLSLYENEIFI